MIESGDAPYVIANDNEAAYRRKQQVDGSESQAPLQVSSVQTCGRSIS